jgi:hypothetical protein
LKIQPPPQLNCDSQIIKALREDKLKRKEIKALYTKHTTSSDAEIKRLRKDNDELHKDKTACIISQSDIDSDVLQQKSLLETHIIQLNAHIHYLNSINNDAEKHKGMSKDLQAELQILRSSNEELRTELDTLHSFIDQREESDTTANHRKTHSDIKTIENEKSKEDTQQDPCGPCNADLSKSHHEKLMLNDQLTNVYRRLKTTQQKLNDKSKLPEKLMEAH